MSIPIENSPATPSLRHPMTYHPYAGYIAACILTVLVSMIVVGVSCLSLSTARLFIATVAGSVGIIALLSGIWLALISRQTALRLHEARAHYQAHWTYPAEIWNGFAAKQREEASSEKVIPSSLVPACGFAAILVPLLLGDWSIAILIAVVTIALTVVVAYINRRLAGDRYREVWSVAEVWIAPGVLVLPGVTYVWNNVTCSLLSVEIESNAEDAGYLVFSYAVAAGGDRIIRDVKVPIPNGRLDEAQQIQDEFNQRGAAEEESGDDDELDDEDGLWDADETWHDDREFCEEDCNDAPLHDRCRSRHA